MEAPRPLPEPIEPNEHLVAFRVYVEWLGEIAVEMFKSIKEREVIDDINEYYNRP